MTLSKIHCLNFHFIIIQYNTDEFTDLMNFYVTDVGQISKIWHLVMTQHKNDHVKSYTAS